MVEHTGRRRGFTHSSFLWHTNGPHLCVCKEELFLRPQRVLFSVINENTTAFVTTRADDRYHGHDYVHRDVHVAVTQQFLGHRNSCDTAIPGTLTQELLPPVTQQFLGL